MEEVLIEETANEAAATVAVGGIAGAIMATFGIFSVVIGVAFFILRVIAYWKIFVKAGKPGWHSIIPVLHTWDEVDLSWSRTMAWVMVILSIVITIMSRFYGVPTPGAENASQFGSTVFTILGLIFIVLCFIAEYKLAKAFGKGVLFFLGLVFLNPIFMLILGFGNAQYQGRQG